MEKTYELYSSSMESLVRCSITKQESHDKTSLERYVSSSKIVLYTSVACHVGCCGYQSVQVVEKRYFCFARAMNCCVGWYIDKMYRETDLQYLDVRLIGLAMK